MAARGRYSLDDRQSFVLSNAFVNTIKERILSFTIGPPPEAPKLLRWKFRVTPGVVSGNCAIEKISRVQRAVADVFEDVAMKAIASALLATVIQLPITMPYSAPGTLVMTWYSRMPSTPSVEPLIDAELGIQDVG